MSAMAKHFDYLPKYARRMETDLGLEKIENKINFWRNNGVDDPDAVTVGCRKVVECSLRSMLECSPDERLNLNDLIQVCEDEEIIPHPIALKCNEIRIKGNNAAHSVIQALDAKMALDLLDDYLRWYVSENLDKSACTRAAKGFEDGVFTPSSCEGFASLTQRASNAAALSDDKSIAKAASKAVSLEKEENKKFQDVLFSLEELCAQADSLTASIQGDVPTAFLDKCGEALTAAKERAYSAESEIKKVSDRVDEILSEHDFIKRLLGSTCKATDEQFGVMAFPKGTNAKTNVLKLRGPAGSGKTLCLLAKLIKQTSQESLFYSMNEKQGPRALFVCFNKELKKHVEKLLKDFDGDTGNIEVVGFDFFINQLVKPRNVKIDWAEGYATDVRFKSGKLHYEIAKEGFPLTAQAMEAVAAKHPDRKEAYYLDTSNIKNLEWVSDEIRYLEGAYKDPTTSGTAKYLDMAPRTGRGGARIPSKEIRAIIVEIWSEYCALLASNNRYTLAQALYRLYDSKQLPTFKAIAIDESQDLPLIAVKVLFKMRENSKESYLYIAGDEDQKIYKNDFTWKQLDEGASGHTISLKENKRNSYPIELFANRLIGGPSVALPPDSRVFVRNLTREQIGAIVQRCKGENESVAIIANNPNSFNSIMGVDKSDVIGALSPKGLEFDNVIVIYDRDLSETIEEERRLRYVHFTRARKRLYVCCTEETPELMKKYYADFFAK